MDDTPSAPLFNDNGREYFYRGGYRVYLDGGKQEDTPAKPVPPQAGYDICRKCGLWRKSKSMGALEVFSRETYESEAFRVLHGRACNGNFVHEFFPANEPPPLSPENERSAEDFPGYVPYEQAWHWNPDTLSTDILGTWTRSQEALEFQPGGSGRYFTWKGLDPHWVPFEWEMASGASLLLRPESTAKLSLPGFLQESFLRLNLGTFVTPAGHAHFALLNYRHEGADPLVWSPLLIATTPAAPALGEDSASTGSMRIVRFSQSYLSEFFGSVLSLWMTLHKQLDSIDRSAQWEFESGDFGLPFLVYWMTVDRFQWLCRHLTLKQGVRLAVLFQRGIKHYYDARLVAIDAQRAGSLSRPPFKRLEWGVLKSDCPPPGTPDWLFWEVLNVLEKDGTPESWFECAFLAAHAPQLFAGRRQGILLDSGKAIIGFLCLDVPSNLAPPDGRPQLVYINDISVCPCEYVPVEPAGLAALGRGACVLVQTYIAVQAREPGGCPLDEVEAVIRRRQWFGEDRVLWAEEEPTSGTKARLHRLFWPGGGGDRPE